MATTTDTQRLDSPGSSQAALSDWERRPGAAAKWGVPIGVMLSLVLLAAVGYGFYRYFFSGGNSTSGALTSLVARERLLVTVTEDGNVESASNIDVKCQVAGGGTILFIVQDGKQVEEGEVIVRLDQSGITDQLNTQKIAFEKAMAAKIQAEEDFSAAQIAVKEYAEGTYIKDLQAVESQITIAMENLRSAESMLSHTERMSRKGFSTPLQLEADQFAVQRAKIDLDAAKTAKTVLEKFTREKTLKGLESTRDAAEARKRSEQAAFELEKGRLERLQKQLDYCVIKAPQSGMAIYANDTSGGRRSTQTAPTIEEGAIVREQQTIFRLPNLSKMQVKVTVHETKVDQLRPGMRAHVKIQDRELTGRVVSIANQPEPGGWMSSNVKEYATIVAIDGETTDLKPGMTAEVEILIEDIQNALVVPISAVVELRGKYNAWVVTAGGTERRPLRMGKTNDKMVEILDGLKEGEHVLLNPRAITAEAREEEPAEEEVEPTKQFGAPVVADKASDGKGRGAAKDPAAASGKESASSEGNGTRSRREGGGEGKGSGRNRSPAELFARFDKNSDKKIVSDEIPEQMKAFFDFAAADTNKDGSLDMAEFTKSMAAMRQRRAASGGQGGQGGPEGERGGRAAGSEKAPAAPGGPTR